MPHKDGGEPAYTQGRRSCDAGRNPKSGFGAAKKKLGRRSIQQRRAEGRNGGIDCPTPCFIFICARRLMWL